MALSLMTDVMLKKKGGKKKTSLKVMTLIYAYSLSLSLSLISLKRVYLYRKLIILNEKNKSALKG
jgi:hypothetical protein